MDCFPANNAGTCLSRAVQANLAIPWNGFALVGAGQPSVFRGTISARLPTSVSYAGGRPTIIIDNELPKCLSS
jgi:hypothetical protein